MYNLLGVDSPQYHAYNGVSISNRLGDSMYTLVVSKPKRPNPHAPTGGRMIYRVRHPNGGKISLVKVADKLCVPPSSILYAIKAAGIGGVGEYTGEFMQVLVDVKRRSRMLAKTHKCPMCQGRGRVAAEPAQPAEAAHV